MPRVKVQIVYANNDLFILNSMIYFDLLFEEILNLTSFNV